MMKCLNMTLSQSKNSCKPADFRLVLQFTCHIGISSSIGAVHSLNGIDYNPNSYDLKPPTSLR